MKKPNRIDPLGPPPKVEKPPSWLESPWVRRIALGLTGAALAASCQFLPWAPVKAICFAVSAAVSNVQLPADAPTADK